MRRMTKILPTTPPMIGPIEVPLLLPPVRSTAPVSDSMVFPATLVAEGVLLPIVLPLESVRTAPAGGLVPLEVTEEAADFAPDE